MIAWTGKFVYVFCWGCTFSQLTGFGALPGYTYPESVLRSYT